MAKTEKRVSITTFDKIAKAQAKEVITKQWFDAEVRVRPILPFGDMLAFVDDVVNSCMQENFGYLPEVREFVVKCNVLTRYANFTLPDGLEHRYELIYGTDAVSTVLEEIDRDQLEEIMNAIDDKLDYLCNANVHALEKQVHKLEDTFETLAKQLEETFSGVSREDIGKVIGTLADGAMSEEKLVEAYMKEKYGNGSARQAKKGKGKKEEE